jgi:hypothetical protein
MPHDHHELAVLDLRIAEYSVLPLAVPLPRRCCSDVLFAQEDKAEGRQGVERDPEDGDELLFEGQRRGLGGLLDVGQLVQLM